MYICVVRERGWKGERRERVGGGGGGEEGKEGAYNQSVLGGHSANCTLRSKYNCNDDDFVSTEVEFCFIQDTPAIDGSNLTAIFELRGCAVVMCQTSTTELVDCKYYYNVKKRGRGLPGKEHSC